MAFKVGDRVVRSYDLETVLTVRARYRGHYLVSGDKGRGGVHEAHERYLVSVGSPVLAELTLIVAEAEALDEKLNALASREKEILKRKR